jgi:hypothetical protein
VRFDSLPKGIQKSPTPKSGKQVTVGAISSSCNAESILRRRRIILRSTLQQLFFLRHNEDVTFINKQINKNLPEQVACVVGVRLRWGTFHHPRPKLRMPAAALRLVSNVCLFGFQCGADLQCKNFNGVCTWMSGKLKLKPRLLGEIF